MYIDVCQYMLTWYIVISSVAIAIIKVVIYIKYKNVCVIGLCGTKVTKLQVLKDEVTKGTKLRM